MTAIPEATSRDLWSHGSSQSLRDLLASSLLSLLLIPDETRPIYFSSPWISDFVLLDNHFRQFGDLFSERDFQSELRFSEYLAELSKRTQIRIITVRNDTSEAFLRSPLIRDNAQITVCFAPDEHHEKGILAPGFYIQGSMNITYSGVWIRGEKVVYHCGTSGEAKERIVRAYLEFDRYWGILSNRAYGE